MRLRFLLLGLLLAATACPGSPTFEPPDPPGDDDDDDSTPVGSDEDGDGISDEEEGADEGRDSDNDGIPDYLDEDSDGDGIPDAQEGLADPDNDGQPGYLDNDSDGDGILDADEGAGDTDGDGTPDYLDLDADGDGISDAEETRRDSDGDGIPDFLDTDSDNDGIDDIDEGRNDSDGDGTPDYLDGDSDNDGIADAEEGLSDIDGDGLPAFRDIDSDGDGLGDATEGRVDTDGDGIADFLDLDSDGDRLRDDHERAGGTDHLNEDTDGDGASDLVEVGLGTDPANPFDNPAENGDLVFVHRGDGPPSPLMDTARTTTNYQQVDVYFMMDVTCSMQDEIGALHSAVSAVITALTCVDYGVACVEDADCGPNQICSLEGSCIQDPAVYNCAPSMWAGGGIYAGSGYPIQNLQSLTPSTSAVAAALPSVTAPDALAGGDEALFQAAECMAQPAFCPGGRILGCTTGGIGCPSFREDALRVFMEITDEQDECNFCGSTAASAGAALAAEDIYFVGIDADSGHEGRYDLQQIATNAGSLDAAGLPFVRSGNDAAVVPEIQNAVLEILGESRMTTGIELAEMPGDDGDALAFIDYVEANVSGVDLDGDGFPDCSFGTPTADTDGNGRDDSHVELPAGEPICWDVWPKPSEWASPTSVVQTYQVQATMRGNGAIIDQISIWFLVAPFDPNG